MSGSNLLLLITSEKIITTQLAIEVDRDLRKAEEEAENYRFLSSYLLLQNNLQKLYNVK